MSETLIRLATPMDIEYFHNYSPAKAEEILRKQGFDLGEEPIEHLLLHYVVKEFGGNVYYTSIRWSNGVIGGTHISDPRQAAEDLDKMIDIYEGKAPPVKFEPPHTVVTSKDRVQIILNVFEKKGYIR